MIKIENYEVVGWEHAIRGMRNPKNSWERSDSSFKEVAETETIDYSENPDGEIKKIFVPFDALDIGPNDHTLMMNLAKGGPVHAKYRRFIDVYLDITAPLYWWKEFDTYKVGTAANSCSTMHKIHDQEFTLNNFSHEHLEHTGKAEIDETLLIDVSSCRDGTELISPYGLLWTTVKALNIYRERFLETKDKKYWWQMIQLLPSSYNQKRTVKLNYEVLVNIYESRKDHKLDEWREFCKWIEELPYSEIIVGEPKTEIAYICDGTQCTSCDYIDCHHTLDIRHADNFEEVGDHKYMEKEHNPLAHPELYVSDAKAMIDDMTDAQRRAVWNHLKSIKEKHTWDTEESDV